MSEDVRLRSLLEQIFGRQNLSCVITVIVDSNREIKLRYLVDPESVQKFHMFILIFAIFVGHMKLVKKKDCKTLDLTLSDGNRVEYHLILITYKCSLSTHSISTSISQHLLHLSNGVPLNLDFFPQLRV